MGKTTNEKIPLREKKRRRMANVDLVSIKKRINKELYETLSSYSHYKHNSNNNIHVNSNIETYDKKYYYYITEEFNMKCISLIVKYIHISKTLSENERTNRNIHKELISITKQLMMNEFEITLFTLLIDEYGWVDDKEPDHLLFIGILTKYHSCLSAEFFLKHFKESKPNIVNHYIQWKDSKATRIFNIADINRMYNKLNKPYNIYCTKDYIDYNNAVDKIIQLSQPYREECQGAEIARTILDGVRPSLKQVNNNNINSSGIFEHNNNKDEVKQSLQFPLFGSINKNNVLLNINNTGNQSTLARQSLNLNQSQFFMFSNNLNGNNEYNGGNNSSNINKDIVTNNNSFNNNCNLMHSQLNQQQSLMFGQQKSMLSQLSVGSSLFSKKSFMKPIDDKSFSLDGYENN
jgi:hypothetical protein